MKKVLFTALALCFTILPLMSQNNYEKERAEIDYLLTQIEKGIEAVDPMPDCMMATPNGLMFNTKTYESPQANLGKKNPGGFAFIALKSDPATRYIRFYNNGKTCVINHVVDVDAEMNDQPMKIKVLRVEVYIKEKGKWMQVAGQGTVADADWKKF